MNILVDTSVWSLSLRRKSSDIAHEAKQLQAFISSGERIYLTGIILQEILQGLSNDNQFSKLKFYFEAFPLITSSRDTYIHAAALFNKCRRAGIQITTVDCLIASTAILYDCHLFTVDKDFIHIKKIVPLQLI